jgi:hypothetical protein
MNYLYTFLFWDGSDMFFYAQAVASSDTRAEEMVRAEYTCESGPVFIGMTAFNELDKEGVILAALAHFGESELTDDERAMVERAQAATPEVEADESDLFVSSPDSDVIACLTCLTLEERSEVDESKVDDRAIPAWFVWEMDSQGWAAPLDCDRCGKHLVTSDREGEKK